MLIIYKITHKESNNEYIGSTKNLNMRMRRHKENLKANDKCHFKLYKFINENGGWDNFDYCILASIDDISLLDMEKKEVLEQKYIDKHCPSLNEKRAYLSKEQKKEIQKQYNQNYGHNIMTCECGKSFKFRNKAKHYKTQRHRDFFHKKPIILTFE